MENNVILLQHRIVIKNQIAFDRVRTDDLAVNSRTLYRLSYKGIITHTSKKMHEAGVEPAHPEIVGLKSTALDHSATDTLLISL